MTVAGLYETERRRVFAVCLAVLRNADDADDATQETFARVLARADVLDGDPRGYLITTARNLCIDELRRRRRQQRCDVDIELQPVQGPGVEDRAVARELAARAWERLAETDRRVVGYLAAGLSLTEIAGRLQITAGLASVRLFRARQRLRRLMPTPAVVAWVAHPAALLRSLLRRGRGLLDEKTAPLLVPLQESLCGVVPLILGLVAGGLGGASSAALPGWSGAAIAPAAVISHPVATPAAMHAVDAGRVLAALPPTPQEPGMPLQYPTFYPSARYASDHTLVAEEPDGTLYQTRDRGRTWRVLGSVAVDRGQSVLQGSSTGQLLLPPWYPASPILYALRPDGLVRSADGGRSFQLVYAAVGQAHAVQYPVTDAAANAVGAAPIPVIQPQSLPSPVATDTPAIDARGEMAGALRATENVDSPVHGDVAALDPASTPGDVRIFLLTKSPDTLTLYDSSAASVTPFTVATDAQDVSDVFAGPGARSVDVVARAVPAGWTTYACAASGCSALGPAPRDMRYGNQDRVMSPTFGADGALWYLTDAHVDEVTHDGHASALPLPDGWYPLSVLPDARHATSRRVDVIAAQQSDPATLRFFDSVADGPFRQLNGPSVPGSIDMPTLLRLADGTIVGVRESDDGTTSEFVCSADGGASWHSHC